MNYGKPIPHPFPKMGMVEIVAERREGAGQAQHGRRKARILLEMLLVTPTDGSSVQKRRYWRKSDGSVRDECKCATPGLKCPRA